MKKISINEVRLGDVIYEVDKDADFKLVRTICLSIGGFNELSELNDKVLTLWSDNQFIACGEITAIISWADLYLIN